MTTMAKRVSPLLVGLLVLLPVVLACDLEIGREYVPATEDADTEAVTSGIVGEMKKMYDSKPLMRRGAHPKSHGCVAAKFHVDENIDPRARFGAFQPGAVFPAWLRFSNGMGNVSPDGTKDVRGVAVKLMGVPGTKIMDEIRDEEKYTQDFFFLSFPRFMARDAREYVDLAALISTPFSSPGDLVRFAVNVLKYTWSTLMQRLDNLRILWGFVATGALVTNPLDAVYWSTTPFMLGPPEQYPTNAVKYMIKPCKKLPDTFATESDNYLRENMQEVLYATDACFDFYVQFQQDACAQPIEDSTVEWTESDSPFHKVGTIRMPSQHFDNHIQNRFCENLTFTPWHSLPEHRPLGGINRPRKEIYLASSWLRHTHNLVRKREPTADDFVYKRHFK